MLPTKYLAKEFIETKEGLLFVVLDPVLEQEKIVCLLRYSKTATGWQKVNAAEAYSIIAEHYKEYVFFSEKRSIMLHAVSPQAVVEHYQAKTALQKILQEDRPDCITQDCIALCEKLAGQGIASNLLGVTGSLMIGAQNSRSDIDLVVYERSLFMRIREAIKQLIILGVLEPLDAAAWQDSYQRRACELSYEEYVWHEQRKYNKARINGRKFDISLVNNSPRDEKKYSKQGRLCIRGTVINAAYRFDYPARFIIEHETVAEIVCYTATYVGQAEQGEYIECAGYLEQAETGEKRLLVGTSREATGEYIKVIHE